MGARFYEMLGYALAVLSFGILLTAVIWRLRLSIAEKRRTLFLVASFAGLATLGVGTLLILVMSQPLSPRLVEPQQPRRLAPDCNRNEPDDHVRMLVVDVKPDGSVLFEGHTLAENQLTALLRDESANERIHVTLRSDAEVEYVVVMQVFNHLKQLGVDQITFAVSDPEQKSRHPK